jgi:hypothetical protein
MIVGGSNAQSGLLCSTFFIMGLLALVNDRAHADLWQFVFGLSGSNTAYDYMVAPTPRAVQWILHMRNSGECLNYQDWQCRFENNDDLEKVRECFSSLVVRVQPWVKLDILRKYCGVTLANFAVNPHSPVGNRERCTKVGGVWGEKSPVFVPGGLR